MIWLKILQCWHASHGLIREYSTVLAHRAHVSIFKPMSWRTSQESGAILYGHFRKHRRVDISRRVHGCVKHGMWILLLICIEKLLLLRHPLRKGELKGIVQEIRVRGCDCFGSDWSTSFALLRWIVMNVRSWTSIQFSENWPLVPGSVSKLWRCWVITHGRICVCGLAASL